MLRHEQEEYTGYVSPLANLRVTPQELAEAVAAVESRREGEGGGRDTIAIGDAIEQLGLSVTPQEVYAEIRRKQAAQQQATIPAVMPVALPKKRLRFRAILWRTVITASLIGNAVWLAAPVPTRQVVFETGKSTPASMKPFVQGGSIRASEVTAERPGYAKLYQLHELATGSALPKNTMLRADYFSAGAGESQWKISKLDGKYVVQGYTYPEGQSSMHMNNGTVVSGDKANFFSHNMNDETMLPRTIPLDEFKSIIDPKWVFTDGAEGVQVPVQK